MGRKLVSPLHIQQALEFCAFVFEIVGVLGEFLIVVKHQAQESIVFHYLDSIYTQAEGTWGFFYLY